MNNEYYLALLLLLSTFTHTQALDLVQYSDISSVPQIALNQKSKQNFKSC